MEPLILYFVLFFPGIYALPFSSPETGPLSFSILKELGRTLTYTVPSLALLWYLISDKTGFSAIYEVKPLKSDLFPFAIASFGLIIIGLFTSLLLSIFSGVYAPPVLEAPQNIPGWIVISLACLGTGYLEESYFRYYLLNKLEIPLPNTFLRIALSTFLFSLCHIYEGPWGILNAVLAGILLSVLFIRFRSLNGIAWAHGFYNLFVYAASSL